MKDWIALADPPEIEIERSWIHTGVHQEALLTCFVHAEPAANVSLNCLPHTTIWDFECQWYY